MNFRIESSSICQLKCPCCIAIKKRPDYIIGLGMLSFENFKKFVALNEGTKEIELANWGEPFLNQDIDDIIKYAYEKGIVLTCWTGSNLNFIKETTVENLVKYKFPMIDISIDGASQEVYQQYRVNGNLNNVLSNIRRINLMKQKYKSELPRLTWKFIVFNHNLDEVEKARRLATEMNIDFVVTMNTTLEYSPIENKNEEKIKALFGCTTYSDFEKQNKQYKRFCKQLWTAPAINWNGEVFGCCINTAKILSNYNAFNTPMTEILKDERYVYAKSMVLGSAPYREDIFCSNCRFYKKMVEFNDFLTGFQL